MAFTLKQALEFNKFTTALSAGGLAYASTVASEGEEISVAVKLFGSGAIICFASSVLFGALVIGRASRIGKKEEEQVDDARMKRLGQWHSWTLFFGLLFTSFLVINKIWKLF